MKCCYCGVDDGPIERACRCNKKRNKRLCSDCDGTGVIKIDRGGHTVVMEETCDRCRGKGVMNETMHK